MEFYNVKNIQHLNEIISTIEHISDWKSSKSTRNEDTNISMK